MEYIFVYGIFRDASHNLLRDAVLCNESFVIGKIYKVNEFYPGYIKLPYGVVHGDVYIIDNSILKEFDEFEGDEYRREKVWTGIDIEAWVYVYKYNISKFKEVIGGDWILR